jgi:hypothetical protein
MHFLTHLNLFPKNSGWNGPIHDPLVAHAPAPPHALAMSKLPASPLQHAPEILNHQRFKPGRLRLLVQRRPVDGAVRLKAIKWLAGQPDLRTQWKDAPLLHGLTPFHSLLLPHPLFVGSLLATWPGLQVVISVRHPSRCCCG